MVAPRKKAAARKRATSKKPATRKTAAASAAVAEKPAGAERARKTPAKRAPSKKAAAKKTAEKRTEPPRDDPPTRDRPPVPVLSVLAAVEKYLEGADVSGAGVVNAAVARNLAQRLEKADDRTAPGLARALGDSVGGVRPGESDVPDDWTQK